MRNYSFFQQKENLTIGALTLLIVMAFVMMRLQHNKDAQNSEFSKATTSKAKITAPSQTKVPHFLPAL